VWIALTGGLAWPPVLLGLAMTFWTAGFDMLYSLQDLDHDRAVGLHSMPARFGVAAALTVARLCHLLMVVVLAGVYGYSALGDGAFHGQLGGWYLAGLVLLAALLIYEHALLRPGDLRRLNRAFFTVNATGSAIFAALGIADVLL
jgi:4-hydroxybenzoate polyprenyltransferase